MPTIRIAALPALQDCLQALCPGALVLALAWGPVPEPSPAVKAESEQRLAFPATHLARASSAAQSVQRAAHVPRLAKFGRESASADARHIANWAFHSGDHRDLAVVIVDKKDAKVYVFNHEGELRGATPALMGSAIGDHTVPGIGDKPIAQVLPAERTTPAGRFVAEPGTNAHGEDVVWVDYDAAVSMHRVRPNVKTERRLERLASSTPRDNRISYGCINLPVAFYEKVLSPSVRSTGAVVYVLPETQSAARLFGAYEVPSQTTSAPN